MNARHIWLIAGSYLKHTLRTGRGVFFLFATLVFGLVIAQVFLWPLEQAVDGVSQTPAGMSKIEYVHREYAQVLKPLTEFALGGNPQEFRRGRGAASSRGDATNPNAAAWANHLIYDHPAIVSMLIVVLLYSVPALILSHGFNILTGDIQEGSLRYWLPRTRRVNIFMGRFLGLVVFSILALAIVLAVFGLYVHFKLGLYPGDEMAMWLLRGAACLLMLVLPYAALCTMVSGAMSSPFWSVAGLIVLLAGIPLFAFVGGLYAPPLKELLHLLPFQQHLPLLHFEQKQAIIAAVSCQLYMLAYLSIGLWYFSERDL